MASQPPLRVLSRVRRDMLQRAEPCLVALHTGISFKSVREAF